MKGVRTVPVDEHPLAMVGHCCGRRFPLLQTLEDGIDDYVKSYLAAPDPYR